LDGRPFEPFGLFAVTPVGIALLAGGLIYFALLGRFLLPKAESGGEDDVASAALRETYKDKIDKGFELEVPQNFPVMTLEQLQIRPKYISPVVGIMKVDGGSKNLAPAKY